MQGQHTLDVGGHRAALSLGDLSTWALSFGVNSDCKCCSLGHFLKSPLTDSMYVHIHYMACIRKRAAPGGQTPRAALTTTNYLGVHDG